MRADGWCRCGRAMNASRRYTVQEKRDLASRPDVGMSKVLVELINQKGETVANWRHQPALAPPPPGPGTGDPGPKRERKAIASVWDETGRRQHASARFLFRGPPDRRADRHGQPHLQQGRDHRLRARVRSAAVPSGRGGGEGLAVRRLCASGWHTAAYCIRGNITSRLSGNDAARAQGERIAAYGPSPGFRNLAWYKPTYVGDTLEYRGRLARRST